MCRWAVFVVAVLSVPLALFASPTTITFVNQCSETIWIDQLDSASTTPPGILTLDPGMSDTYEVPDVEWVNIFWPKSGCGNSSGYDCLIGDDFIISNFTNTSVNVANTGIIFMTKATPSPFYDYFIDVSYGFSFSVSVTPNKPKRNDTTQPGQWYCDKLEFKAFPCPATEYMTKINASSQMPVNLVSDNDVSCLSPCAEFQYYNNLHEYVRENRLMYHAYDTYCCIDTVPTCNVNETAYMTNLRKSGSTIVTVNEPSAADPATMASCDTDNFTVVISCDVTPANTLPLHQETLLYYPTLNQLYGPGGP